MFAPTLVSPRAPSIRWRRRTFTRSSSALRTVRETSVFFFTAILHLNDRFTKTGSGQTYIGNVDKKGGLQMARRKRRPRGRSGCTSRTTRGLVSGRAGHHRWSTQCRRRRCDLEREREIRFKNDLARFHCFAETAGAGLDCNRRTLCAKGSTLSRLLA